MGYILENRLEVAIFVNGIEYDISAVNLLPSLHITTSARGSLPLLTMQLDDVRHQLDTIGMQDGIQLRVVISANGNSSRTYHFRKFNHKKAQNTGYYTWTIFGYWDAPKFWNATTAETFQGTSSELLAHVASVCSMKYDGPTTSDAQLWLPQNMRYRAWAKDAAAHGYINDQSCMGLGVGLDGVMYYRDVNNLPPPTRTVKSFTPDAEAYTAIETTLASGSGFNNALTGYQNMRIAQSLVVDAETYSELNFKSGVKSPQFNIPLRDTLGRGAVRFGPIDCGNVHPNYEKAQYQNQRYSNLYMLEQEILLMAPTELQLLECFNYSTQKENTDPDVVNSGIYIVTSHSLYIQGANYAEKIGVVRHGTNDTYTGG